MEPCFDRKWLAAFLGMNLAAKGRAKFQKRVDFTTHPQVAIRKQGAEVVSVQLPSASKSAP